MKCFPRQDTATKDVRSFLNTSETGWLRFQQGQWARLWYYSEGWCDIWFCLVRVRLHTGTTVVVAFSQDCTNYELLRFGARLSRLMITGARLHSINLQLTQTGERGQTVHRRTMCTIAYRHEFDCCNGHNSDVTLSVHNASHQAALKTVKCVSLGLVPKRSLIGSLFWAITAFKNFWLELTKKLH